MKHITRKSLFLTFTIFLFSLTVLSQPAYQKLANDTFKYHKISSFGKPGVAKRLNKIALAQVRVHFKYVTTEMSERKRKNNAKVSVYLDGKMTDSDLQKLTDEFYQTLARKFAAAGISSVNWEAIKATEYYTNRVSANEGRKFGGDAKQGQAWASYTANGGPVFYRMNIVSPLSSELLGFGKIKKIARMSETLSAEIGIFDAVVDFTDVAIRTNVYGGRNDEGQRVTNYTAGGNISPVMSIPFSNVMLLDRKKKFDIYRSQLPVSVNQNFSGKVYKNTNLAKLNVGRFFGDNVRFTFEPRVVPANREKYIAVARKVLNTYADLFVEKMKFLKSGGKNRNVAKKNTPVNINTSNLNTPKDYYREGKKLRNQRNYQAALKLYNEGIKKFPKDDGLYLDRSATYEALGKHKEVIKDATTYIKLKPKDSFGYYNRGTAYLRSKKFKKALKDLEMAGKYANTKMQPLYLSKLLANRGFAYIANKNMKQDKLDLDNAIKIAPRNPDGYRIRAVYYEVQGNKQLAQADKLRAAQLSRGQ